MKPTISIILPCFNEERGLRKSIDEIMKASKENNFNPEIIVVDNASTDKSKEIAKQKQVRYIYESNKGYGNACSAGIKKASNNLLIMADCDGSYDFNDIPKFLAELENNDLVLGNRWEHRQIMNPINRAGNWVIRRLLRLNGLKLEETCTGFIGARRDKLLSLNLEKPGMEFSSELLVKSQKRGLKIQEIDINFRERIGKSKLRRFRDGFRHLKFLLFGI